MQKKTEQWNTPGRDNRSGAEVENFPCWYQITHDTASLGNTMRMAAYTENNEVFTAIVQEVSCRVNLFLFGLSTVHLFLARG
jgi:hypothetical protein